MVFFVIPAVWDFVWDSRLRYALQYATDMSDVTVEKRPEDCDFLYAPIGKKGCAYEKVVSTVQVKYNNDMHQNAVSYDDGKTWIPTGDRVGTKVLVQWAKK